MKKLRVLTVEEEGQGILGEVAEFIFRHVQDYHIGSQSQELEKSALNLKDVGKAATSTVVRGRRLGSTQTVPGAQCLCAFGSCVPNML